mmetsp:Transcript_35261/g.99825  ORF Transcript_35261/g.99825 Transcript_35261/m.99825 type:complete len:253 (-) Transcript_35261:769-1527(-)
MNMLGTVSTRTTVVIGPGTASTSRRMIPSGRLGCAAASWEPPFLAAMTLPMMEFHMVRAAPESIGSGCWAKPSICCMNSMRGEGCRSTSKWAVPNSAMVSQSRSPNSPCSPSLPSSAYAAGSDSSGAAAAMRALAAAAKASFSSWPTFLETAFRRTSSACRLNSGVRRRNAAASSSRWLSRLLIGITPEHTAAASIPSWMTALWRSASSSPLPLAAAAAPAVKCCSSIWTMKGRICGTVAFRELRSIRFCSP